MRLLIMAVTENPGVRRAAAMAINELFLPAKEIAAAEKLVGGAEALRDVGNRRSWGKEPLRGSIGSIPDWREQTLT